MGAQAIDDSYVDGMGMPTSDGTTTNPSVDISNPDQSTSGGFISSLESYAGSAVDSAESAVSGAASSLVTSAENSVATVYGAAKNVGSSVVNSVEGVTSFAVNQVVLLIAVLGVALYFVGKTGALKIIV